MRGATNFMTGAGGLLQTMLFGYAGYDGIYETFSLLSPMKWIDPHPPDRMSSKSS